MCIQRFLCVPILALPAMLQMESAAPPPAMDEEPAKNQEPALSGPIVADSLERTLVQHDFQSGFVRLEERPEEAAMNLLELEPSRREAVREKLSARRAAIDMLLIDNIDLVKETTDAIQAGDQARVQELSREMFDRFDPAHERDPLMPVLMEVLNADEQAELRRLVDEYWSAWIDWELRNARDRSDPARQRVQERLAFALFQQEVRQAYERTLRPYREKLEAIYAALEPTDEQRAAIRAVVIDFIRETRLQPTAEQRSRAARQIYDLLDEQDRIKLFELILTRL